jgi:hypothetical protein
MHPVHTFPPYFPKIHFNIILPSAPMVSSLHIFGLKCCSTLNLITLIIFGEQYKLRSPHCANSSILMLLPPSELQITTMRSSANNKPNCTVSCIYPVTFRF